MKVTDAELFRKPRVSFANKYNVLFPSEDMKDVFAVIVMLFVLFKLYHILLISDALSYTVKFKLILL